MAEQRSAQEVLDDHLATSLNGSVEDDLRRNYAREVVIVSNWGVKRGHDGVREMARLLRSQLPDCTFAYKFRLIEDGIGLVYDQTATDPGAITERLATAGYPVVG
jgi:hypothetical protein